MLILRTEALIMQVAVGSAAVGGVVMPLGGKETGADIDEAAP